MLSRSAVAAASAARACATDAVSSIADSSATTSPARTRSPLRTLMAASWPATSGATRTSVVRTTPTMDADSGRDSQYPPMLAATAITPSAMMRAARALAMHLPPLHEKRGYDCECEIDDREAPQPAPIANNLPQAGAQLI